MFSVLYTFVVKENREDEFVKYWSAFTQFIYEHAGSLGSRLHRESNYKYLAYALWPDQKTFDNANEKLPQEAIKVGEHMRDCCVTIDTLSKAKMIKDLLRKEPH